jgi:hypothetical protein
MSCTARIGENEQLVGSVRLRPLRELVGGIGGQRELVEQAFDRCRDGKERTGIAIGASTVTRAFGGHCDGSGQDEAWRSSKQLQDPGQHGLHNQAPSLPAPFHSSFSCDDRVYRRTFGLSDLRTRYAASVLSLISHGATPPVFSATLTLRSRLHLSLIRSRTLTTSNLIYGLILSQSANLTGLVESAIACAGYQLRAKPATASTIHYGCDITNHF